MSFVHRCRSVSFLLAYHMRSSGADPGLAQSLTEGGLLWVTDLTEPDPWYGLPILGGLLLYANVEIALGKRILSGEATSKANVAVTLKDFFQSECLPQAG